MSIIDIVFLLVLIVAIITRLYSVLGSNGEESGVRMVMKPMQNKNKQNVLKEKVEQGVEQLTEVVDMSQASDKMIEKNFNKDAFLQGASRVFEIVVSAFSKGDLLSIKELVSKKVFDTFKEVLNFRQENNLTSEVDFICFDRAEVKDIKMLKNSMKVVVEFVTEQVNLLRNAQGEVVEGDENFVQKITDIWTFERSYNANNKGWLLVSTKKTA